jgi:hypothetical protein
LSKCDQLWNKCSSQVFLNNLGETGVYLPGWPTEHR